MAKNNRCVKLQGGCIYYYSQLIKIDCYLLFDYLF